MIKKQLGLLAGSLMVAASSSAEIPLNSNVLFVFNKVGYGTYYQKYGWPVQSLANGFSIDLSAASAALGGSIDSFAILALKAGACSPTASIPYPCYNYNEGLYVELGGGLVYTADSVQATTNLSAQNAISSVQDFLSGAELGLNVEGSAGDFDASAYVAGYLISSWFGNFPNTLQYEGLEWFDNPEWHPDYPLVLNKQTVSGSTEPCAVLGYGSCLASPFQDTPAVITGSLDGSTIQGGFTFGTLSATDVDGLTDGTYFTVTSPPVYGQAQINPATGLWTYLAEAAYVGADPFTVTVTDDLGGTTEQVIAIDAAGVDTDGDTIADYLDNCPLTPNTNQLNLDNDALGDECDEDIDGDGVDNDLDTFPFDPSETSDADSDTVGNNSDNCVNDANTNQLNIDSDSLGDVCDPDMDGDGVANAIELYFGGDETNSGDAAVSQANILALSETAQQDADYDGVPDEYETAVGGNATSSTYGEVLNTLTLIGKNVPAMGGIGLFVMFSSLIGLGFLKRKKRH